MHIWVDADACPKVIKEILYRVAHKRQINTTFVANHGLSLPPSPYLKTTQVGAGFDIADNHIVQRLSAGDLVITADIPLADEAISRGATAINPRGALYTKENIKQRLTMRNFMEEMRSAGMQTGGPAPINHNDRQAFANQLDRLLTQRQKQR